VAVDDETPTITVDPPELTNAPADAADAHKSSVAIKHTVADVTFSEMDIYRP